MTTSFRKLQAALSVLSLSLLGLISCDQAQVVETPLPSPLIYEISNADGDVEGWMLGTIHALPESVDWRTEPIEDAIADADFLMVEIADLENEQDLAHIFAELGQSPDLPNIEMRVPREQRASLNATIEREGFSSSQLTKVDTWAAALMLASGDPQSDPRYGVDRVVIREFEGRNVVEFEGARAQLSVFDQLAEEDQRVLLRSAIKSSGNEAQDPAQLRDAWIAGDVTTIEAATITGMMTDPELRDALLVQRNKDWMAKLEPVLAKAERPLIAVGAAHLVGDDGLTAMLKDRGYTVRRLR
ncbi:MAG: TraB/GumN family protein [Erythrobacter sp.]